MSNSTSICFIFLMHAGMYLMMPWFSISSMGGHRYILLFKPAEQI